MMSIQKYLCKKNTDKYVLLHTEQDRAEFLVSAAYVNSAPLSIETAERTDTL